MSQPTPQVDADRRRLIAAQQGGISAKLWTYSRLSGPGWLQSAITLGGGSLASGLYLGVVAGFSLLWVQPIAMALGIIMLSGIAYVTLSTGERPFGAINRHVNPVLGWSWALAALAANMFWCLPQYHLAAGVLEQNLLPNLLGPEGSVRQAMAGLAPGNAWLAANGGKLVIAASILVVTTIVTWSYQTGRWGIKLYEVILKLMVAGIVVCFVGVIWKLRGELAWGAIARGFIPDWSQLFHPSERFQQVLQASEHASLWSATIVREQREIMISAAATAVGINMTFLFPYSLLAKGWTREFRGLVVFDLSTGMLIPFVVATSCVVIAAADRFHTQPVEGFLGTNAAATKRYYELLTPVLQAKLGPERFAELAHAEAPLAEASSPIAPSIRDRVDGAVWEQLRGELGRAALELEMDQLPEVDQRIAAMLIRRSPFDLAKSLAPLTGDQVANIVFGLGVLGMTLSTITILMLISGFAICEMLGLPPGGWPHRLGCLAAATGVLGPFIWSRADFYLAVYVSVFGMMLLPIAYLSFWFLMNRPRLLGSDLPRGGRRWLWNGLLGMSATVATAASAYSIWSRTGRGGCYAIGALLGLAIIVQVYRWTRGSTVDVPPVEER